MPSEDREKYFKELAEVPLPYASGLIERKWELKSGRKGNLDKYETKFLRNAASANFNLLFYKYPPDIRKEEVKGGKFKWLTEIAKASSFSEVNSIIESALPNTHLYKILKTQSDHDQIKENLRVMFGLKHKENISILDMKTTQPLIVGLGETSPYETGITLDFLTGLPIIPGSAIKGIARRAAIMKLSDKTDILPYGEEFKELAKVYDQHEQIVKIFGTQERKGKVIFMDAYPVKWSNGLFRIDIMNPHYGPYYESKGKEPPADWYNPVPVPYLTVNIDVTYRFILASKDSGLLKAELSSEDDGPRGTASEWLKFALENIGIGAKGSQGYGVFKVVS